jgi:hypothetical protein
MKKSQLELALRMAGKVARDSDFIVFGSQSVLGTVAAPPKICMVSMEVDLYPRRHPQAVVLLATELGARSAFFEKHGFFVDCVTPDLAAFPEGWTDRLVPFRTRRTGGVTGWCVEPHDVSASKLAAAREKDLIYVRALLAARLIRPVILENRIATLPVNSPHRGEISALARQLVREANALQRARK